MTGIDRRLAVRTAAALGVLAGLTGSSDVRAAQDAGSAPEDENPPATPGRSSDDDLRFDRECVLQAGMTEDEADCWRLAAELAGKFFALPELHPSDKPDIANAIHVVQHRLLSRPTYRAYLAAHKAPDAASAP